MQEQDFELIDFGDLLLMADDIEFLIHPILPIGLITLLAARGGIGKSAYALYIANKLVGQGKRVLYLDGESCTSIFKKRCLDWKLEHWHKIKTLKKRALSTDKKKRNLNSTYCPNDLGQIDSAVSQYKPDLVIIDSLTSLARTINLNDKKDVTKTFLALTDIASDYSTAILILAHTKKKQNTDDIITLDSIAGSGTITDLSKSVLLMENEPGSDVRVVSQVKNNITKLGKDFTFTLKADGIAEGTEISTFGNPIYDKTPEIRTVETKIGKIKRIALDLIQRDLPLKEVRRILKKEEQAFDAEIKAAIDWASAELNISWEKVIKN